MSEIGIRDASHLRSLLHYDPNTGVFTRAVDRPPFFLAGEIAGSLTDKGYNRIGVNYRDYPASRLAWLYMTGEWPLGEVDHKNTIRNDDRWHNLRPATRQQNCQNMNRGASNKSGFKGVSWHEKYGKWRATIKTNGKSFHLGYFDNPAIASEAYKDRALKIFGAFARVE